jgi:hypothetical protein
LDSVGLVSQKIEHFITTAVRTLKPTSYILSTCHLQFILRC